MSPLGIVSLLVSGRVLSRRVGRGFVPKWERLLKPSSQIDVRLVQLRVAVPFGMGARAHDGCCWAVIIGFLHRQQSDRVKGHVRAAWGSFVP